jgi:N-acetylmuramoyl-L-alanine amidase
MVIVVVGFFFLFTLVVLLFSAEQEHLSIYTDKTSFSTPVLDRHGKPYVCLTDVLQTLGDTNIRVDGNKVKVRFGGIEGELKEGSASAKIHGKKLELAGTFQLENGRGLVPLTSLSALLSNYLASPVEFHQSALRLFVGNAGIRFSAQLVRAPGPSLVLSFSSPVNPTLANEPGKLHMVFQHEPVLGGPSPSINLGDKALSALTFSEGSGTAELTVSGAAPLIARFSPDRKTITVTPVELTAAQAGQTGLIAGGNPSPPLSPVSPAQQAINVPSAPVRPVVIVDASHGGTERGASLTDTLAEKDVVLSISRRVRNDLQTRGIQTAMLRDSDVTLSLDQRASLANSSRATIYISIHAVSSGEGVRVYTGLLPPPSMKRNGPFQPWETAQADYLSVSQKLASAVSSEFGKMKLPVQSLPAPLPPLNHITAAAIAVEVAPQGGDAASLTSIAYQEQIANAVAAGLGAARSLGVGQ